MKKLLIYIVVVFFVFDTFSQSTTLGRVFPMDTIGSQNGSRIVSPTNLTLRVVNDTMFYNAGAFYISTVFPNNTIDSILSIVDTVIYRNNIALFIDSATNVVTDTMVQKIGLFWKTGITFNESLIEASRTMVSTQGISCYFTLIEDVQSPPFSGSRWKCRQVMYCNQNGPNYFEWCQDTHYTKVYEDNFGGNSLDENIWGIDEGPNPECHCGAVADRNNIEVSNGTLKLWAGSNCHYGSVTTHSHFGYGKFEISAKIPNIFGTNPAYWLFGENFEIDGFEFFWANEPSRPRMTIYSNYNGGNVDAGCQSNGAGMRRIYQVEAKTDGWNSLPDLNQAFHQYTLVWDPNNITWIIDNTWYCVFYKTFQSNYAPPYQGDNCGCTTCWWQQEMNFPNYDGTAQFKLGNGVWGSKSLASNGHTQTCPPTACAFEIDWVRIYQVDNCGANVNIPTENSFAYTNHNNQNDITGDNITLGGAGDGSPFLVDVGTYFHNGDNFNLFVRANNEIHLKDGFSINSYPLSTNFPNGLGSVFEASIAYDGRILPGYTPDHGPSDCNNINDNFSQYARTQNSNQNNGSINNTSPPLPETSKLNNNNSKNFRVFPNPTQDYLFVEGLSDVKYTEVLGATLQTVHILYENQDKIDVKDLTPGLYFLRIYCKNKTFISKFIKQ